LLPIGFTVSFVIAFGGILLRLLTVGFVAGPGDVNRDLNETSSSSGAQSLSTALSIISGVALLASLALLFLGGLMVIADWIARTAHAKGRSYAAWFWLGFFFPLIAWIIVASISPTSGAGAVESVRIGGTSPETKSCPYCAESILAAAIKCKHCGEMLTS